MICVPYRESQEILQDFSELGRKVPEFNDTTIREIFVYSYRLIYKLNNQNILFVAVVHGKRLLENHQQSITKQRAEHVHRKL